MSSSAEAATNCRKVCKKLQAKTRRLCDIEPITTTISNLTPLFVDQYHVVKHILEYLRFSDVLRASQVNKQWAEIGRVVRKQRKNAAYCIIHHPYMPHHKLAFEYFNGFEVSDEAERLVESGNNNYHPFKSHLSSFHKHRFPGLLNEARTTIKNSFLNAYDEPQMLVSFGTSSFDKNLGEEPEDSYRKKSKERMKLVLEGVNKTIPCISTFSCGLVATIPESDTCKTLEMEKVIFPCLSCLAVPKVAGLQVKHYTVTKEQNKALKGNVNVEQCKQLLGIESDNEGRLKGIVLFHKATHRTSPLVDAILQYLKINPHIPLAGGVHESVLVRGIADDTIIASGLLIYGDENVRVSSIALQESKISQNNQNKINKLKSCLIPGGSSFAIMFACNGRGRHMHGRPHVESELFNSHFPATPLAGAFTLGEFCHEVIPTDSALGPPRRIDFAYTTVFLLVSYKHSAEMNETS